MTMILLFLYMSIIQKPCLFRIYYVLQLVVPIEKTHIFYIERIYVDW
jgi:hypothetical protein